MIFASRAFALVMLLSATVAFAQPERPMRFKVDRACDGMGEMCAPRIFAEGTIQADTPDKFASFVRQRFAELPPEPTVSFDSFGGNMIAAMLLGQSIRILKYETEILDGQSCASACALSFLGGVKRSFDRSGRYGVHQFFAVSGNIGDAATQVVVVAVAKYIESMGARRELLDAASLVPPRSMLWLSEQQLKQFRVDNSEPLFFGWTLGAEQSGRIFVRSVKLLPGDRMRVEYIVFRQLSDVVLRVRLIAPAHKRIRLDTLLATIDMEPMQLLVDGRIVLQTPAIRWTDEQGASTAMVTLPASTLQAIHGGSKVSFLFKVPRVAADMDPSADLSATNLAKFLPAVHR